MNAEIGTHVRHMPSVGVAEMGSLGGCGAVPQVLRRIWYAAEMGTTRAKCAFKRVDAEMGSLLDLANAELGTLDYESRTRIEKNEPDSAWTRGQRRRLASSNFQSRVVPAESGTVYGFISVENPVKSIGYPRRFRYADHAETGSVCRRIGFGRTQNRVRKSAEMGSAGAGKRFQIKALLSPYTVYE